MTTPSTEQPVSKDPTAPNSEGDVPVQEPPSIGFRMLQIVVWGMGALLFFGVMGLAFTVVSRSDRQDKAETVQAVAAGPMERFDPTTLPLPAGARIEDMALDGTTLVLRLTWSDGVGTDDASGSILWFYDVQRARVMGELRIP
ncbi:MAG: hypothetical protein ACFB6R_04535 [Alphaproteobacteria bacterium]